MSRPDHAADDPVLVHVAAARVERLDDRPVAQDRDRVGHGLDLGQLVRDEDAGDALGAELAQLLEQLLGIGLVER